MFNYSKKTHKTPLHLVLYFPVQHGAHRPVTGAQSKRDRAKSKTSKWAKVALASQPKRSTNSFPGATRGGEAVEGDHVGMSLLYNIYIYVYIYMYIYNIYNIYIYIYVCVWVCRVNSSFTFIHFQC